MVPFRPYLDVTVIHPLQAATRAGAATTPGYALTFAYDRKVPRQTLGEALWPSRLARRVTRVARE